MRHTARRAIEASWCRLRFVLVLLILLVLLLVLLLLRCLSRPNNLRIPPPPPKKKTVSYVKYKRIVFIKLEKK